MEPRTNGRILNCYLGLFLLLFSNINLFAQTDTIYDKRGNITAIGTTINGKKVGVWYSDFKNGIYYKKMTYLKHNKVILEIYSNNNTYEIIFLNHINVISNKLENKERFLDAKIEMKRPFRFPEYVSHGNVFYYYPNGNIYSSEHFKRGLRTKKWKTFYVTGEQCTEAHYKITRVGKWHTSYLHGKWYTYYKNGQIMCEGRYKKDGRIGTWNEYYENGKLKSTGSFSKDIKPITVTSENKDALRNEYPDLSIYILFGLLIDLKSDKWEYYDDTGKLIKEEFYEKGKLVKMVEY